MSRRPTNTVVISTRLPEGMPERIDAIAGPGRRAEFIREAIEQLLARTEENPAEYHLQRAEYEPDDRWAELMQRWHKDHREQQQEIEAIKRKLDALVDVIMLQIAPGAGRNRFKKAMAIEFKKHFADKLSQNDKPDEDEDAD